MICSRILLFVVICAVGVAHSKELNLQSWAQQLGCHAAFSQTDSKEILCFQNGVLDAGQATETKGCSLRRYDIEKKAFTGFPSSYKENQIVLTAELCEDGGLDAILNLPVSETKSVMEHLQSLFDNNKDLDSYGLEKAPALFKLNEKLKMKITINQRAKGAFGPVMAAPGMAPAAAPYPRSEQSRHASVQVFFGSDRQDQPGKPPAEAFGEARNTKPQLTLGSVTVSIPAHHKFGNLEVPDVFTMTMTSDPDRYMVVKSVDRLDPGTYWKQLQTRVHGSKKKELFVFVHGFNVSFEEAAQRTAQMAYDLKFAGAPVFYSWPSETILRYPIAEKNVEWTLPHLTAFLKELTEKSGATEIHLVAHSMGNRALTNALNALAQARPPSAEPLFKNVILAAPDVDQKAFQQIAASVRSTTSALTLYASNNDKALQISARLHKGPRLGQIGAHTLTSTLLDTIDASAVDVSFLGHSYYGDNPSVVSDMAKLVTDSLGILERPFLKAVQSVTGNPYWKLLTE